MNQHTALTCKKCGETFKALLLHNEVPPKFCCRACEQGVKSKRCGACGKTKPLKEWGKSRRHALGLQSQCYTCRKVSSRKYYVDSREKINERSTKIRIKKRLSLLSKLGKKCANCGETNVTVLQIDHVNNDGGKERRDLNARGLTLPIMNAYLNGTYDIKRIQILCANCNFQKQYISDRYKKYIEDVKKEVGY